MTSASQHGNTAQNPMKQSMYSQPDPPSGPTAGRRGGWLGRATHAIYGVYALGLLALLMLLAGLFALLVPTLNWRRRVTRAFARLWLRAVGLLPHVSGLGQLPAGSCVLVANHSSYLDGVVMKAALPPRFSFVIKREAAAMPVLGFLLRRIGSQFVDRSSHGGRHRDARRVVKHAEAGHSLVFFPEGTFDEHCGLKRFHVGAFVAAARGNVAVVPAVIHGARRALPNRAIVPRPGRIHIEILAPLALADYGSSVERLRDEARHRILQRLEEPDLIAPATLA
jgi:1-acyl-sn-glycerol-3-phosphate acyltransferase